MIDNYILMGTFNLQNVIITDFTNNKYDKGIFIIVANKQDPTQYVGVSVGYDKRNENLGYLKENGIALNISGNIYKNPRTSRILYIADTTENIKRA